MGRRYRRIPFHSFGQAGANVRYPLPPHSRRSLQRYGATHTVRKLWYFPGDHDILHFTKKDSTAPNNRIVNNMAKYITDTAVRYFVGKGCRDTTQKLDIYLNFIGRFEVPKAPVAPEVVAAQEEERRLKLERQERLDQNYLKRKANGKQQEYDRRYYEKRKARVQASVSISPVP